MNISCELQALPSITQERTWYALNRRLDGPQSQSVHFGEEINLFCSYQDSIPRLSRRGNSCYTDHATPFPKYHPWTGLECLAMAALHHGKKPFIHCTEGWVVPRAGLDLCIKSSAHIEIEFPEHTARSNIKLTSYICIVIYTCSFTHWMHTCIICMYMCLWLFYSLIMVLQGLKHGSFNNRLLGTFHRQCLCWLIYRKKQQYISNSKAFCSMLMSTMYLTINALNVRGRRVKLFL
jgi:hypothetical protein